MCKQKILGSDPQTWCKQSGMVACVCKTNTENSKLRWGTWGAESTGLSFQEWWRPVSVIPILSIKNWDGGNVEERANSEHQQKTDSKVSDRDTKTTEI